MVAIVDILDETDFVRRSGRIVTKRKKHTGNGHIELPGRKGVNVPNRQIGARFG